MGLRSRVLILKGLGNEIERSFRRWVFGEAEVFVEFVVIGFSRGEAFDGQTRVFQCVFQALGLRAGVGMVGHVKD